ncbi:Serine/threonine protein kinase [Grimontia indica]|uniref:Serine/threonine protein kinase n=1 Tax=Grimontia indica TaxID=1056512 RepID=R1ID19_9GAMM|nr:bifunctional protein-serine/threonine kinase/phosphatase [Grimontia indica]EOD78646.1 Serine/threonine protein kinase [Grimontia indica]
MKPEFHEQAASYGAASTENGETQEAASRLIVRAGGSSVAGRKPPNQDAFAVYLPKKASELKHKGVVAAIADGVSTSEVSQKASEMGVTEFVNNYLDTPITWPVKDAAGKVMKSLNYWLYHHGQQAGTQASAMVAAFCSVIVKSNTAHVFHIGDCRVYLWRQHRLTQITQDHRHYQSKTQHHLTRALGIDSHLNVDYQPVALERGDLLFLATDGIHDTMTEREIAQRLYASDTTSDLEHLAASFVDDAYKLGSDDNITCLLLAVDSLPAATYGEALRDLSERKIPPVLKEGQKIDHYTVARVLYSGSRSHIYLTRSDLDGRQYVLKMPSLNFADDAVYLAGFIREGWIGEQVKSPGVMKIHPPSSYSPYLYHVCDYIEGVTLRQWMIDNPTPTLTQVRTLAKGAIRAVRVLQRLSVVHRDIKPDNLMVDKDMNVTLIDYGTAQSAGLEELMGSEEEGYPVGDLNYAAPEYLKGNKANFSSDLFSLGMTVYELLTGHLPYKAVNASNPRAANRQNYVPATVYCPGAPDWFDEALKKACHPIPKARYQALSEFEQDLMKPNPTFKSSNENRPLLESDPLRFWKGLSLILFLIVLVQFVFLIG